MTTNPRKRKVDMKTLGPPLAKVGSRYKRVDQVTPEERLAASGDRIADALTVLRAAMRSKRIQDCLTVAALPAEMLDALRVLATVQTEMLRRIRETRLF